MSRQQSTWCWLLLNNMLIYQRCLSWRTFLTPGEEIQPKTRDVPSIGKQNICQKNTWSQCKARGYENHSKPSQSVSTRARCDLYLLLFSGPILVQLQMFQRHRCQSIQLQLYLQLQIRPDFHQRSWCIHFYFKFYLWKWIRIHSTIWNKSSDSQTNKLVNC